MKPHPGFPLSLGPLAHRKSRPEHSGRALTPTLRDAQQGNTRPPPFPPDFTPKLGQGSDKNVTVIHGPLFTYHGSELTVPPEEIAMAFATTLPYRAGMPGPSFSWSAYADSVEGAVSGFEEPEGSDRRRISPFVTERMDESLVVLSRHLAWSVADLVNVVPRKVCRSPSSLLCLFNPPLPLRRSPRTLHSLPGHREQCALSTPLCRMPGSGSSSPLPTPPWTDRSPRFGTQRIQEEPPSRVAPLVSLVSLAFSL
jgi:hypothetical protein